MEFDFQLGGKFEEYDLADKKLKIPSAGTSK